MKIKLDENLPAELLDVLRAAGHDAASVLDEGLTGAADPVLLDHAKQEGRVLFTMDKGVGNISVYPPERHAGVVLFRPASAGRGTALDFVRRHLWAVVNYDLQGKLLVVTERGIRLR